MCLCKFEARITLKTPLQLQTLRTNIQTSTAAPNTANSLYKSPTPPTPQLTKLEPQTINIYPQYSRVSSRALENILTKI